jgi:putative ABC transport system permease protein
VGGVSAVVVKPRSVVDAYRLRARHRTEQAMAVFPAEVLVELYAMLGDVRDLLTLLAFVTQGLVMIAVLLAVCVSLSQRRRQVGVLRALGASRGYVFGAVWLHVTLLVAAGSVAGLALGWGITLGLARLLHARTGLALPVVISSQEVAMVAAVAAAGAALAVLPAWRSYRQPAAAALRA